jgi:hypothetical protein
MPSFARVARMAEWAPNVPLDVAPSLYGVETDPTKPPVPGPARDGGRDGASSTFRALWYEPLVGSAASVLDPASAFTDQQRLDMLQFHAMLQPPVYLQDPDQPSSGWRSESVRVERDLGRGLDLSRWLSTPCLVVVGTLRDDGAAGIGMPVPFTIDGQEPAADGTTVVRVVFPLPSLPGGMLPPPAR